MSEILTDSPNTTSAAPINNPVSDDSILAKMTAMRNQNVNTEQTGTGSSKVATEEAPVAPAGVEDNDTLSVEPEVVTPEDDVVESQDETEAPQEVSEADSNNDDIIDFVDFAKENPNFKFKFMRNGKEMMIDVKQAQAILGQGGAIHEEARQLKIQKAEFDEYLKEQKAQQEGLTLAMEFAIVPQLQRAYDEIKKVQGWQSTFNQQLAETQDPAMVARIQASMEQNEKYIQQQSEAIRQSKPKVDLFKEQRKQQVATVIETNRKAFTNKELRNEYVFNEVREKVSKGWASANTQLVPGIANIDLVSSDEHIMTLLYDGLKYREKPQSKSAGNSIAALTKPKGGGATNNTKGNNDIDKLRETAKKTGDKKAWDTLLAARMSARKR